MERIDEEHANAKRLWREIGEPTYLSAEEVEQLQSASRTVKEPQPWNYEEQAIHLAVELPPQSVAAIRIEFAPTETEGGTRP